MSALSAAAQDEDGAEIKELKDRLNAAKGRYHTQLAICDLFDLCGLPNERKTK